MSTTYFLELVALIGAVQPLVSSLPLSSSSTGNDDGLLPNIQATYGQSPAPFQLNVDQSFIERQRELVAGTRVPVPIDGLDPPYDDGPTLANFTRIRDYWVDEYDWNSVQASINQK